MLDLTPGALIALAGTLMYLAGIALGILSESRHADRPDMTRMRYRPQAKPEYCPRPGDRWSKLGPVGTVIVERALLPGYPRHDGGANGVSVKIRQLSGKWKDFFVPAASGEHFAEKMHRSRRRLQRSTSE